MSSIVSNTTNASIEAKRNILKKLKHSMKCFFKQLIGRKSMLALQSEIGTKLEFQRSLNWIQLFAIGVGGIIGK